MTNDFLKPQVYDKAPALGIFLEQQGYVVLDGGLATELENRGASLNDPLWSARILLSDPELIADIHYAYFVAGADVAITASYQATFPGLEAAGLSHTEATVVLQRSVIIAAQARDSFWADPKNRGGRLRPLIAASVGPYGAFLHDGSEYRGDYRIGYEELKTFHRERLALLTAGEADLIACESIPSLVEARALTELLSESPTSQAWISFTCKDDTHISDGTTFADAVEEVSPSVAAVGLNCTAPRFVNSLLEKSRRVTDKPLVVYPNSGEIYNIATCSWQSTSELTTIEQTVRGWRDRGARLVGGCCRTTPATIRGIRRALSDSENS